MGRIRLLVDWLDRKKNDVFETPDTKLIETLVRKGIAELVEIGQPLFKVEDKWISMNAQSWCDA